jgi:hypothetical protein
MFSFLAQNGILPKKDRWRLEFSVGAFKFSSYHSFFGQPLNPFHFPRIEKIPPEVRQNHARKSQNSGNLQGMITKKKLLPF